MVFAQFSDSGETCLSIQLSVPISVATRKSAFSMCLKKVIRNLVKKYNDHFAYAFCTFNKLYSYYPSFSKLCHPDYLSIFGLR